MQEERGAVTAKGRREETKCFQSAESTRTWHHEPDAKVYKVFISLRALSSSSLIALNFSFWVYSSSAGRRAERERAGGGKVQNCADRERESGGKKREKSDQRSRIGKSSMIKIWIKQRNKTEEKVSNEVYLLGHLWSFPAWPPSVLQIPHAFPPLKKRERKKTKNKTY